MQLIQWIKNWNDCTKSYLPQPEKSKRIKQAYLLQSVKTANSFIFWGYKVAFTPQTVVITHAAAKQIRIVLWHSFKIK